MRKMVMGLFILVLSIWCYIFGVVDEVAFFCFVGVFLPIPAIIIFIVGYFDKGK